MPKYQQYVVLAHNPTTGEAEWTVFTGRNALESATIQMKRWCARDGWCGFVRPTDEPVAYDSYGKVA